MPVDGVIFSIPIVAVGFLGHVFRGAREVAGTPRATARHRRAAAFGAGVLALLVALVSPLDAVSAALFSAHMVQHLLLILVAAPLLVLGAPAAPLLLALPAGWRRGLVRWRRLGPVRSSWSVTAHPLSVWGLHAGTLWVWHLPLLYEAALRHPLIHALEHAAFLATAALFWWLLLGAGRRPRLDGGAAVLYLFVTAMQGGLLGVLMTFSPEPWYPSYTTTTGAWGLTPLQDQHLAGLIMWVPAGAVYGLVAAAIFVAWLQGMEDREAAPTARGAGAPLPDDR
jgi:cytochrome c oxidase assembly factor CtaG